MVEYFSGKAQVSEAFRQMGHVVASFDYELGDEMDFLSPAGFAFLTGIACWGLMDLRLMEKICTTLMFYMHF